MFTGLVQAVGVVRSVSPTAAGARVVIDPGAWGHRASLGDSIAVSGCCLTVAAVERDGSWAFDAVPETLAKTTLGTLAAGSRVNLEHAVTPSTLLGGHLVQGHVDGVGRVESVEREGEWRVRIAAPAAVHACLTPKGSVAVEGVSLTIAAAGSGAAGIGGAAVEALPRGSFEVALIPETLARTTLRGLTPGAAVNIEADVIAKTVVRYLEMFAPPR